MSNLKVLLPIDSSEFSKAIADEVLHLYSPKTHNLTFIRVATDYKDTLDVERLEKSLTKELNIVADYFQEKGYQVDTAVRFGKVVSEIVRFAEGENIDLIAMTTHGRSGLDRLRNGSVAGEVLRSTYIPVTMVRPVARLSKGVVTY